MRVHSISPSRSTNTGSRPLVCSILRTATVSSHRPRKVSHHHHAAILQMFIVSAGFVIIIKTEVLRIPCPSRPPRHHEVSQSLLFPRVHRLLSPLHRCLRPALLPCIVLLCAVVAWFSSWYIISCLSFLQTDVHTPFVDVAVDKGSGRWVRVVLLI